MIAKRKRWLWAGMALCLVLLLASAFLSFRSPNEPLQLTIRRQTNSTPDGVKFLFELRNDSRRFQNYAYWAEVRSEAHWVEATNWAAERAGQLHWIAPHMTEQFTLSAPEGS